MKKVNFKRRKIGGSATVKDIAKVGVFKATFGFDESHPLFKAVGWKRKKTTKTKDSYDINDPFDRAMALDSPFSQLNKRGRRAKKKYNKLQNGTY